MEAHFDHNAQDYDITFSHTLIGKAQRDRVWRELNLSQVKYCLELNCGTGEDALRLASKNIKVLATDISTEMVEITAQKLKGLNAEAKLLDINSLGEEVLRGKDLIFSNFGGLNCLSPEDWEKFADTCSKGLVPEARLVFVIMSKNCLWEKLYFLFKGDKKWERNSKAPVLAHVDGKEVPTWYYEPREIKNFFKGKYKMIKKRSVGFFVPPSYLEPFFKRRPELLKILVKCDQLISKWSFLASFSDHYYIEFKQVANG